jgi:hypothetical protein
VLIYTWLKKPLCQNHIKHLAPGLDLLKARLQGSNLVLGVLQVVLEVILMPVKICKISTIYSEVRLSATQNNK